jgi:hypothetical protein
MFDPPGDKIGAVMFGGYFWGTLLGVAAINLQRWFLS